MVFFTESNCSQKVVGFMIKELIIDGDTRSNHFGNAPLDNFFLFAWLFELLTNSYSIPGAHESGQISIQRMVRESGKLNIVAAVVSFSQGNAQYFRCGNGIFGKGFVEITNAKQHNSFRVFRFQLEVLFHQRRYFAPLLCCCVFFFTHDVKVRQSIFKFKFILDIVN